MQDTTIYKGEMVYQFRLDVDYTDTEKTNLVEGQLQEWFSRYYLAKENKKSNNVMHLQGILWRSQPLSDNDKKSIRTWFIQNKVLNVPKTGGISLTSARKIESLAKYCNDKEKKGTISFQVDPNLLGDWINPQAQKAIMKDKLIALFKSTNTKCENLQIPQLLSLTLDLCLKYEHRPPPLKTILWYALQAKRIHKDDFSREYYGMTLLDPEGYEPYQSTEQIYPDNPYNGLDPQSMVMVSAASLQD